VKIFQKPEEEKDDDDDDYPLFKKPKMGLAIVGVALTRYMPPPPVHESIS
jgi:hypothetical protein